MFQDKTLTCVDCGADFIFSADEQEFYAGHQLTNEPKRCKPCREKRKSLPRGGGRRPSTRPYEADGSGGSPPYGRSQDGGGRGFGDGRPRSRSRATFKITCHACGKEDEVPFEPKQGREVYCRDCYSSRRQQ